MAEKRSATPARKSRSHPTEELETVVREGREPDPALVAHLDACRRCRTWLESIRHLLQLNAPPPAECPPAEDLVRAFSRHGDRRLRAALDPHLSVCLDCAFEVETLALVDRDATALPGATGSARPGPRSVVDKLRALVTFEMPLSYAVNTRAVAREPSPADYREGMEAYRSRRYDEASRLLRRARDGGERAPGLDLYLGACLMSAGKAAAAVPVFEAAVKTRPRLGEYRWYLAQALLSDGRGHEALRQLERVAALRGPYREPARKLRREILALLEGEGG